MEVAVEKKTPMASKRRLNPRGNTMFESENDIGNDQDWQEAGLMSEAEGDQEPVTDQGLIEDLEKEGSA